MFLICSYLPTYQLRNMLHVVLVIIEQLDAFQQKKRVKQTATCNIWNEQQRKKT